MDHLEEGQKDVEVGGARKEVYPKTFMDGKKAKI